MDKFTSMKPVITALLIAVVALSAGIAIGRYTASPAPQKSAQSTQKPAQSDSSSDFPPVPRPRIQSTAARVTQTDSSPPTSENIVAALKGALSRFGSRRTFVEFGKLSELINQQNVGEVLAFAETITKPQEKNAILSMLLGRWAEFDPQAALTYAETLPA